jgi:hypothetical protein
MHIVRTVTRPSFEHRTALTILVLLALSGCGSEVAGTPGTVASFSGGTPTTLPRRAGADAKKTDYGTIGLALQPGQTINQTIVDPRKAVTGDVNGRPAVQEREALGHRILRRLHGGRTELAGHGPGHPPDSRYRRGMPVAQ